MQCGRCAKENKVGTQNGANASDMQRKQTLACKTMQMQRKTNAGTQNGANASDMQKKTKAGAAKPNLHA